jgi:ethanolamine ammonia-lyase small subunit
MSEKPLAAPDLTGLPAWTSSVAAAQLLQKIQNPTPARILVGSAGPAYRTATWLQLRSDHAAAMDAVWADLDLARDFPAEFVQERKLFTVQTLATNKQQYLLRPDLGRRLSAAARDELQRRCTVGHDLQFVIGDGLSAAAVRQQVPELLPRLEQEAQRRELTCGQSFIVRFCRVGVMNDVGELLDPGVVILLIGERPGLATADSLSAYLAYRPRQGHTDAQRNLISNIHARGIDCSSAAVRILNLAESILRRQQSGVHIKESGAPTPLGGSLTSA